MGRDTWHGRQVFCPSIAELSPSLLSFSGRAQVAGFVLVTPGSSGWFSFYKQTFTSSSPASDRLYVCSALEEVRQLQQLCEKPRKWFSRISQVNKHTQVLSSPILKGELREGTRASAAEGLTAAGVAQSWLRSIGWRVSGVSGSPNPPHAPEEEYWEMFGSSFVSVFFQVQKGSGVTGLLGASTMPIMLALIGVKPLLGSWIWYLYI